jgi:type IV pilus assembly protein PilV
MTSSPLKLNSGFTMIEVLVTLVILLLGLLGLSGLQVKAQQAEFESYQRTQALVLMNDMADRINRNRETAPCYDVTTGSGTPHLGTGNSSVATCSGVGTANSQQLAIADMTEWENLLLGTAETLGGNNAGAMIGARGCIARDNTDETYTIAVAWQGSNDTAAPAALASATTATENAIACGANQYGDEKKRRVVWTTLRIARLR